MEEGLALITLDPDPYRQLPSVNQRQPVVGRVDPLGLWSYAVDDWTHRKDWNSFLSRRWA